MQQAQLAYSEAVYARNVRLASSSQAAESVEELQSQSQRNASQAQVAAAQANLQQAELNLNWTKVRSRLPACSAECS